MAEFNLGQVAFFDKGLFSLSETYTKWDFVTTTDSTYLCVSDTPIIGKEVTNTTYWKCIADGKPATLAAALAVEKAGYAEAQGELAQTARENIEGDLALKIDKTSITSELGVSEELIMSQAAVTAISAKAEADAIQLLRLHNPDLVFSGFVNLTTSQPAHTANKAYFATQTGAMWGISGGVVKGQVIKDTGAAFVKEDIGIAKLSKDLDADGHKGVGFAAGSAAGDLVNYDQLIKKLDISNLFTNEGFFIEKGTGVVIVDATFECTDFLELDLIDGVHVHGFDTSISISVCSFFDSDKNYLGDQYPTGGASETKDITIAIVDFPVGSKYIKCSALVGDADNGVFSGVLLNGASINKKLFDLEDLASQETNKEKVSFHVSYFVSGTETTLYGTTTESINRNSYYAYGNEYKFTSDTKFNVIKNINLTDKCIIHIYDKTNSYELFTKTIETTELATGYISIKEIIFYANIEYYVYFTRPNASNLVDVTFDTAEALRYITRAIGIETIGDSIVQYGVNYAMSSFQLMYSEDAVFNYKLLITTDEIYGLESEIKDIVFGNEIAIPSKLYGYKFVENHFNFKHLKKYPDRNIMQIQFMKNYDYKAVYTPASRILTSARLFNDDFKIFTTKSLYLEVADVADLTGPISFVAIGDSLTEGGRWINKTKELLTTKCIFDGCIQSLEGDITNMSEGRAGWTVADYFEMSKSPTGYYSPFMHPVGKIYYGVVEKNAADLLLSDRGGLKVKLTEIGFEASGYPTTPITNESVVYSVANARYEIWNGSAWIDASLTDNDFVFNYETYRSAWNIPQTDVLYIMLGTNDFWLEEPSDVPTLFTDYATKMDAIIASARADNAGVKIGIGIANTYTGSNNNHSNVFCSKATRSMWESRKLIIETYDNATNIANGIFVVDWGIAFDTEYGFAPVPFTPYIGYSGAETFDLDSNVPHPSATINGYAPMGQLIAGWICYLGL